MHGLLFGEFMGTLVLILLGDGVVANVLLNKSKGQNSGWIVITTGWAFAVTMGICTALACGSPFAFINPAVALTVCILPCFLAEVAGGLAGGILVYLVYLLHWKETEDPGLKLAIFCTGPAIKNIASNTLTEVIATAALITIGLTFGNKAVGGATGLAAGWGPWLWGVLVWGLGLSLGGPTGYAMNPARDHWTAARRRCGRWNHHGFRNLIIQPENWPRQPDFGLPRPVRPMESISKFVAALRPR